MKHKDKWLPIVLMMITTCVAMGVFFWMKTWNTVLILPVTDVAGEETDPSIGRLITCLVFFVFSVASAFFAVRVWKKEKPWDNMPLTWMLAALGGTLLWTSFGECSWHFGFNVMSDEGEILFTNFPRIESAQGIPLFFIFALALVAGWKKASFPMLAYCLAFGANWYGHLCMIGAYPVAMACGTEVQLPVFYRVSGLAHTVVLFVLGVYLIFKLKKRENKYYSAVLLYIALGTLMFGVMMGET